MGRFLVLFFLQILRRTFHSASREQIFQARPVGALPVHQSELHRHVHDVAERIVTNRHRAGPAAALTNASRIENEIK